jgi:hypothetical protein
VVKLLKEKFVCVALDARKERGEYKDADGDFVRATGCVTVTASGSVAVVTAGGKALGPYAGPGQGMEKWLQAKFKDWEALPEAERKPGAVTVPRSNTVDPRRAALALPPGAMIVRVFNRHLGWDKDKSLRSVVAEDYLPAASKADIERYGMAQNDFMWVPEKEWRALVPAEPRKGEMVEVPTSFALRLFRYHLDPCRGFSEGAAFLRARADAGRLTLTVQETTESKLSLRLEGEVKLQQPGREGVAFYEPAILGLLDYDRSKKCFTRFDLLALGTASGLPTDANGVVTPRKGPYPLGIAFELVRDATPAEHLHPRGARDNPAAYLEPKDNR